MEKEARYMEFEIQLKISELELEHKYWEAISNVYAEKYVNSDYTDTEKGILLEMAQNLRDLTYLKLEMFKKMI